MVKMIYEQVSFIQAYNYNWIEEIKTLYLIAYNANTSRCVVASEIASILPER